MGSITSLLRKCINHKFGMARLYKTHLLDSKINVCRVFFCDHERGVLTNDYFYINKHLEI